MRDRTVVTELPGAQSRIQWLLMKWISIKDKLPEKDSLVLITDGERVTIAEWYQEQGWGLAREDKAIGIFADTITHWMPLPAPPNAMQSSS